MALNVRCSIALFATLAIFSTFSTSHAWNIGGKTPVDVHDPAVNKAAQFAVSELNKRNGKSQVTLREVVSAQKQIVAGMNYILVIKLVDAGQEVLHRTTVYDQFEAVYDKR